jgi:hypothetical protein
VPAAAERLQGVPDAPVRGDRQARPLPGAQQPQRLGAQEVEVGSGQPGGGVSAVEPPGDVEQADPPVELPGQLGDGRAESVRSHRGERDGTLRGEGPGAARVGVPCDRFGVGLRDRDEGRLVGHLEQRQSVPGAGGDQDVGGAGADDLGAEPERHDTAVHEPPDVGLGDVVADVGLGTELRAGREQPLSLGEERGRVLEVRAVQPGQRGIEGVLVRVGERAQVEFTPVQ